MAAPDLRRFFSITATCQSKQNGYHRKCAKFWKTTGFPQGDTEGLPPLVARYRESMCFSTPEGSRINLKASGWMHVCTLF